MEEFINSLDEATIFTTLDAKSGYWQAKIEKRIEIEPLSPHATDYIVSSASHLGYATVLAHFSVR